MPALLSASFFPELVDALEFTDKFEPIDESEFIDMFDFINMSGFIDMFEFVDISELIDTLPSRSILGFCEATAAVEIM